MAEFKEIFENVNWEDEYVTEEEAKEWYNSNKEYIEEAKEIWTELEVEIMSTVAEPAQRSEFLAIKSEDSKIVENDIAIKSEDNQVAVAPAMTPEPDKENDLVPPWVIQQTAHKYLLDNNHKNVDEQHESAVYNRVISDKGNVVESWVLNEEREFTKTNGDSVKYPKGTWLVATQFEDKETWEKVKNGEYQGYSIHGYPETEEVKQEGNKNSSMDIVTKPDVIDNCVESILQDNDDITESEAYAICYSQNPEVEKQVDMFVDMLEDSQVLYETEDEAREAGEIIGVEGIHEHELDGEVYYMPAETHEEFEEALEELLMDEQDEEVEEMDEQEEEQEKEQEAYDEDEEEDEKMDMEKITDMMEEMLDRVEDLEEDVYPDDEDTEELEEEEEQEEEKDEDELTNEEDPCWENYEMVGLDENGDPICVPEEDAQTARSEVKEMLKENYQIDKEADEKQTEDEEQKDEEETKGEDKIVNDIDERETETEKEQKETSGVFSDYWG